MANGTCYDTDQRSEFGGLLEELTCYVDALTDPEHRPMVEHEVLCLLSDLEMPIDPRMSGALNEQLERLDAKRHELFAVAETFKGIAQALRARDNRRWLRRSPDRKSRHNRENNHPNHPDQRPRRLQTRWEDFIRSDF